MLDDFLSAIHNRNKVRLTFFSKDDKGTIIRVCAPMDYGPSRRAKDQSDRFHLWDYESDTKNHVLSLRPEQVLSMDVLADTYDPQDFITWDTKTSPWFIKRDWGVFS